MTAEEALYLIDFILPRYSLSTLQETVFCGVWAGQTYAEIAERAGYEHSYIRDVGFKLWQMMSEALGQKVSKSNLRAIVSRYARVQWSGDRPLPLSEPSELNDQHLTSHRPDFQQVMEASESPNLEFPSGPVPLTSSLYVERRPIEFRLYAEIMKPGSLVRIKGQPQTGKTSLLLRLLAYAKQQRLRTVSISLHKADREVMTHFDRFLRWLSANVSRQLNLTPQLEDYWNLDIGSKVSCTAYFEEYVFAQVQEPVLIALDEINQIFEYPNISNDFLPLLRSWYEDAKEFEVWKKVRWVIVHSTDVYVPLNINQSPFNVGLSLSLPDFTADQTLDLAQRHGFDWAKESSALEYLQPLINMVGGRPNLIRLALYYLKQTGTTLKQLLDDAPTTSGIYGTHLRNQLLILRSHPDLTHHYRQIVQSDEPIELEAITIYRLENMGLVRLVGNRVQPACELYRQFFKFQLADI
ncbi:MAG: AAA-like domain-containing protein [Cyanobacteria bacterium P01_A01_bin.37]